MGEKGARSNEEAELVAKKIVSSLQPIGDISSKKMFGGHGIFCHGKMFAMVNSKAEGYFKLNDLNKADFESFNAPKHSKMPYAKLPAEVLQNEEQLLAWAYKAITPLLNTT